MCLSQFGKTIYLGLMFVIFCMTVVGIFTPHWRDIYLKGKDDEAIGHVGLASGCGMKDGPGSDEFCKNWYDKYQPSWEKAVRSLLYVAAAIELIAMTWVVWSYIAFCFHHRFMHVLPFWSILVFLFLMIPAVIYAAKKEDVDKTLEPYEELVNIKLGYSFVLICVSGAFSLGSLVLGILTSWLSDKTCC